MKPIILSNDIKEKLFEKFIKKFTEEVNKAEFNVNDTKISFTADISEKAKDKVTILFTPVAYLRMLELVREYTTEVGWYGLVDRVDDKTFKVYDVKVCKQYVDGAKVDTEDDDVTEFFDSLTDEEANHMHYQAHSHVSMSTNASGVDLQNQTDVVKNMSGSGFYIFQIWNKRLEISTYIYDLDNNVYYDSDDVVVHIEDEKYGTMEGFVDSIENLVLKKTPKTYFYYGNQSKGKKKSSKETEEDEVYKLTGQYPYDNNYYNGYRGYYDY